MADGSLIFDTRIDQSGFEKGASSLKSAGMGLVRSLGVAFSAGAIAKGMVSLSKKSIDLASDLQEVQNVVDVTFGTGADEINDWAIAASGAFGLSELAAKQYVGTMGAMLKSMGLTGDAMQDMSTDLVGLAGDFASFYNINSEEAFAKIRAGISGEIEPLRQLGINMSIANLEAYALSQGIEASYQSMSQAEQATLRYNYLMSVSTDAQGDFARTSDSLANQQRITQLAIENVGTAIGRELIPAATEATKVVGNFATGLATSLDSRGIRGGVDYITDAFPIATAAVSGLAAAYTAMLIIQTVQKASASYAKTVAALTAMEKANSITLVAMNGGLTAQQLIVGVLTGKISLATAAQGLFNATIAANPIGAVVVAIGALVGGAVLLTKRYQKLNPEIARFKDIAQECVTSNETLRESMEASASAYEQTTTDIERQSAEAEHLVEKLFELSAGYSGSATDQRRLQGVCDALNDSVSGLNVSFDKSTGAINMTADAIYGLIEAQKQQARQNAISERYTEILKEQAEAEWNLSEAQYNRNQFLSSLTDSQRKILALIEAGVTISPTQRREILDVSSAYNTYQEAVDGATESVALSQEEERRFIDIMESMGISTEDATAAIAGLNTEVLDVADTTERVIVAGHDFTDIFTEMGDGADAARERLDTFVESARNMFDVISEETEGSVSEWAANLNANAEVMERWGENIAALGQKLPSDLLNPLIDAGPEEMAGVVAKLAQATDGELTALTAAFERAGTEGVNAFLMSIGASATEQNIGETLVSGVASQIADSQAMDTAGQEAIVKTKEAMELAVNTSNFGTIATQISAAISSGMSGLTSQMYSHGQNAVQGLVNGLSSKKSAVVSKINEIADAATKTFTVKLSIQSPSKVFYQYGQFVVEGFTNAIEDNLLSVKKAMSELGDVTAGIGINAANANIQPSMFAAPTQVPTNTTNVTQNIYGMERTPATILREAIFLQERAVLTGV